MSGLHLARVLFRWRMLLLGAYLLPPAVMMLFAVVQADAIVDWERLGEAVDGLTWWQSGLAWAAGITLGALSTRRLVRRALLGPDLGWVRRQPLSTVSLGIGALGILGPAAFVYAWLGVMLYGKSLAVGLAWWVLLVAAMPWVARGWRHVPVVFAMLFVVGALAPRVPLSVLAAAYTALDLAGRAVRTSVDTRFRGVSTTPRSVVGALVLRDLLVLWRTRRDVWISALLLTPLAGGVSWLLAHHTGLVANDATRGLIVITAVVSLLGASGLSYVVPLLGRQFDPRALPVAPWHRIAASASVAMLLVAPSYALAAAASSTVPVAGHVRGLLVWLLGGLGAAWLAGGGRPVRVGTFGWWMTFAAALAWPGDLVGIGLPAVVAVFVAASAVRVVWRSREAV